jgi:hypothetical protein
MGDFRVDIKINIEMNGKKFKRDCWLNYNENTIEKLAEEMKEFCDTQADCISHHIYFEENYEPKERK